MDKQYWSLREPDSKVSNPKEKPKPRGFHWTKSLGISSPWNRTWLSLWDTWPDKKWRILEEGMRSMTNGRETIVCILVSFLAYRYPFDPWRKIPHVPCNVLLFLVHGSSASYIKHDCRQLGNYAAQLRAWWRRYKNKRETMELRYDVEYYLLRSRARGATKLNLQA